MKLNLPHFSKTKINPQRDWRGILFSFVILSLAGVIYGAYVFYRFENPVTENTTVTLSEQNDLGTSRLHKIVSDYEKKNEDYEIARTSVYNVGDPSLP